MTQSNRRISWPKDRPATPGGPRRKCRKTDWRTPGAVLASVQFLFEGPPDLDPATTADNPVGAQCFFTPQDDGLRMGWRGRVFLNPPYGRDLRRWIEKAADEWRRHQRGPGIELVLLLPVSRTETQYWQRTIGEEACAVCWVRDRLAFLRPDGTAAAANPFASVVVYLGTRPARFCEEFSPLGICWRTT